MSGAHSVGETKGAERGTCAMHPREICRGGRGLSAALIILLLASLAGTASAVASGAGAGSNGSTEHPAEENTATAAILEDGISRYTEGAPVHALEMFLDAAQSEPTAALPWIWAGIAATAAGKMRDADDYFKRGLERPHTAFQDRVIHGWRARLTVFSEKAPGKPGTPQAVAALARTANPRLTPAQAAWLGDRLVVAARQYVVDPWLLAAVVYIESRFDQTSVSRRGARGLGQLMPQTARAAGVNARDPWGNLVGTAMTLSACYREFHDWRLALAAYNAGPTAVYRYRGIPPFAETRWYVTAVLAIFQRIRPG